MKAEFDEVVPKLFQNHQFNVLFLDNVFNITHDYVGTCEDFLHMGCAHAVSQSSWTNDMNLHSAHAVVSLTECRLTAKNYTYDDFITGVDMINLLKALEVSSVFGRGLPLKHNFRMHPVPNFFKE